MKLLFGGLISVILLGVYLRLVWLAVRIVQCTATKACIKLEPASFNQGMAQALSVIGGLISALVIAELAVTAPGRAPLTRVLSDDASTLAVRTTGIVASIYVLAWMLAGVSAFLVGLDHPDIVPALTTHGQGWLGLAVSASYAYFGLTPSGAAGKP